MARKHIKESGRPTVRINPYLVNAVAPMRLEFWEPYGVTDDVYFKMTNVTSYASTQRLGWGSDFAALKEVKAPVAITCYPANAQEVMASANRTINAQESGVGLGFQSYADRRRRAIEAEYAAEITDMILRDNVKMLDVNIYIMLRADEKAGLDPAFSYLKSVQNQNVVKSLLSNTEAAFWAASPLFLDDEFAAEAAAVPMPTITVAWARMLDAAGIDDLEGVLIGSDNRGGIVRLDLQTHTERRQNSNILIIGETGSGKSSIAKHIILIEHLIYDTRVIVLNDPEGEYAELALRVGGDVSRVGRDCNISPFEPRCIGVLDAEEDEDEEIQQAVARARSEHVLATTIPFVKSFLEMAFAGITDDLLDMLDVALELLYLDYGITPETTFEEYFAGPQDYPVMSDLYDKLNGLASSGGEFGQFADEFGRLALAIRSAAVGYDKHMWNTKTRFDSRSGFTVIDTQGLSSDVRLKQAQYYNLITWTWSQVRSQRFSGKHFRIVADEVHTIMNKECVTAAYQVKNIVQRIRKYDGGMMCITPMISDLMAPVIRDAGQAVAYSSTYKFFGKSSGIDKGGNLYEIKNLLKLEDPVRDELADADRGRFILSVGTEENTWVKVDAIKEWEFELFGRGGGS